MILANYLQKKQTSWKSPKMYYIFIRRQKTTILIQIFVHAQFDNKILYLCIDFFCNIWTKNVLFSFEWAAVSYFFIFSISEISKLTS